MGYGVQDCYECIYVKNEEELKEYNDKRRQEALDDYRGYQNFFNNPLYQKYKAELAEIEKIYGKKLSSFLTLIGVKNAQEIRNQRKQQMDEIKEKYSKLGLDFKYSSCPSECPAAYIYHYDVTFCRDEFCIAKKYSIKCAITDYWCFDEDYYDESGDITKVNCRLNCNGKN